MPVTFAVHWRMTEGFMPTLFITRAGATRVNVILGSRDNITGMKQETLLCFGFYKNSDRDS